MVNYDIISKINRSNIKLKILEFLQSPKTVMELAKTLDKHKTSISRAIQDMLDDKLIICKNPNSHNFRYYQTTDLGVKVLKEMKR